MTTPTTPPITASVGSPTPIPERPTLYAIAFPPKERGSSWRITQCADEDDMVSTMRSVAWPGSASVTIPGSTTTPAPASGEIEARISTPIRFSDVCPGTVFVDGAGVMWTKVHDPEGRSVLHNSGAIFLCRPDAMVHPIDFFPSTTTRDSGQGENDPHTNLSSAEQENERLHGRMAEALEACVAARLALTNHNLWCGHNKHAPGHPSCREAEEKLDRVLKDMAFTVLRSTQPTPSVGSGEAKGNT